jgi:hypothetical protein
MLRKILFLTIAAMLVSLIVSGSAQAWGGYHVGYTHYSPYTGLHHYGSTGVYGGGYHYGGAHYGGYGGGGYHYGGYHYGGYHYGGYGGYGGAHYGYYRRW